MHTIPAAIYQTQQIREFERLAVARYHISEAEMMQRAGQAALDIILRKWPRTRKLAIFCGTGNNGGDGYVLAKLAHEHNLTVTIYQVGNHASLTGEAKSAWLACQSSNISMQAFNAKEALENVDLIVDAICGIGGHGELREQALSAVEKINTASLPVLAMDIPTGIEADSGRVLGSACKASATITFIGWKLGLLTGRGMAHAGELYLNRLDLPTELFALLTPTAEKIVFTNYTSYLKHRPRDWHKGLSGHVLIIGGEIGYTGAPRMAAEAALRVGAGLVTILTKPEHAALMNITHPEIMSVGVTSFKEVEPYLSKANVIVIGPGLGQSSWAKKLWEPLIKCKLPLVMDADGLNLLAQKNAYGQAWVLTPHPGEAARLLKSTAQNVQDDRLKAAQAIVKQYGGVCVLKGAGTVVVHDQDMPAICDKGNPGMASAGMGDVLSGVIGGLLAQGVPNGDAARLGVYLHAIAGDSAARDGERGLLATDVIAQLRRLSNT